MIVIVFRAHRRNPAKWQRWGPHTTGRRKYLSGSEPAVWSGTLHGRRAFVDRETPPKVESPTYRPALSGDWLCTAAFAVWV